MFKFRSLFKILRDERGSGETTTTTITETIPTIIDNGLLEMIEGDVTVNLVTRVPFSGPGIVHNTPFYTNLTSEADDSLANQAVDTGGSLETSPATCTVGVHGGTIMLKEIAELGSVDNVAAVCGKILGQMISYRRELDLVTLFTGFTNQGAANVDITPGDLYDAYGLLQTQIAKPPYFLVMHPQHIWSSIGIISFFDNGSNKFTATGGVGSVGEDFYRNGYTGMILGFELYGSAAIATTSNNASGCAFNREAIKYVEKRGFRVDVMPDVKEVGIQISGTAIWGEVALRTRAGTEMQFNLQP